ncbi:MAG TPA: SigB/SigF/SigG family RNA polymerase sigma factor [Acidimicrobiales bacterium]|nr:SigB/SigF/SigG family RNA polymerase sigma factor [Acidimicrobiales bacterium]
MQTTMTAKPDATTSSKIRRARRVAAGNGADPGTRERRDDGERFRRYRATGDRKLRNALIEDHRWLALHCAKRFANKGEPLDDLIQVAMLGVLKAVERYDPDFGATFATFAVPTITGELRRHFRDTTWAVHVPRRAKDLQHTVKVAVNELGQVLGRSPTVEEIAVQAGVPVEEVLEALEAARCYRKTPLAASGDDGELDDLSTLGDHDIGLDAVDAAATVGRLLDELPPRERRIVELRYMGGLTQSQIAELVGVSQVQVSRLLRASLARMKDTLTDVPGSCAV